MFLSLGGAFVAGIVFGVTLEIYLYSAPARHGNNKLYLIGL